MSFLLRAFRSLVLQSKGHKVTAARLIKPFLIGIELIADVEYARFELQVPDRPPNTFQ
jgi:hypothetical protein